MLNYSENNGADALISCIHFFYNIIIYIITVTAVSENKCLQPRLHKTIITACTTATAVIKI